MWVLNHSKKMAVSTEHLRKSLENDQLKLIITSSSMLMGLNVSGLKIAVMLGPLSMMADLAITGSHYSHTTYSSRG